MLTMDEMIEAFADEPQQSGDRTSTGLENLDDMTGGLVSGHVWIVTGTPGQGRTTLLTQWAARVAAEGCPTRLICPRETRDFIVARLLACTGRFPLLHLHRRTVQDTDRLAAVQNTLRRTPLHVATEGQSTFLNSEGGNDPPPPARAVLIDDADLIAGVSPDRVSSIARQGIVVVVSLPRHLLVRGEGHGQFLDPPWARVADVVMEVRQAQWPDVGDNLRPGEADLSVIKNRWGPTMTDRVVFQGHYSRFVDM